MRDLLASENFKMIMDHINDGVQVFDADGNLVYCNRRSAMLDDINIETALGKSILEIYPSLTKETSTLLKVIRGGMPMFGLQQTYTTYKGKKITTLNSTLPLRENGKIVGAIEFSNNITEVKALSEKVVDLQNKMYGDKKGSQQDEAKYTFADIVTDDVRMLELKSLATKGAQTDAPILVCGETGTGKELFVQAIHNSSRRVGAPFIAQNCAALPTSLLEGILFGTMRGSFTGSVDRPGLFELADGGTLFLDEINSMPMELQAKLLRVLQEGVFRRIGDMKPRYANVRIITAVNVKPEDAVRSGNLRQDLYYRLNTITINLPSLKERSDDIPYLSKHFVKKYNNKLYKNVQGISAEAMLIFRSYDWPGNVRELEHVIEGAISVMDTDEITVADLPIKLRELKGEVACVVDVPQCIEGDFSLKESLEQAERAFILKAYERSDKNITQTAKLLNVPRQTLQYKLKKLGISG